MTALPPATDFTGASVTEAQFKTAMTSLRAFLAELIGIEGTERPGRNVIINGNFDIWQRGTSFTAAGVYTADRWVNEWGTGGAGTVSQQSFTLGQTDVSGEPTFFYRQDKTTAGSSEGRIDQRIEDVRTFSGETATVSFYAKAASGATWDIDFVQDFGTGGAPSGDVSITSQPISVTTSWQKFTLQFAITSISGKTIGTALNSFLALRFRSPDSATFTLDIARVQVELGSAGTPFERRTLVVEMEMAQRFYTKTFALSVTPAEGVGLAGSLIGHGTLSAVGEPWVNWQFPTPMRTAPTVVLFNVRGAGTDGEWDDNSASSSAGASASNGTEYEIQLDNGGTTFLTAKVYIHATADAEL